MTRHPSIYLDARQIEQDLVYLLSAYPELADDAQLRADVVEGETDLHSLLSRIADAIQDARMMQDALTARIVEVQKRRRSFEAREETLRALAQRLLERAGQRKAQVPEATFSLVSVAPRALVLDPEAVPDEFKRTVTSTSILKPDLTRALREGREIPGATLSNGSETLQIRTT